MRVTFSNVLYMRGIFEPDQFKPMNVGGITVQTIASESLHPNAKQVVEWMDNGVFDALQDLVKKELGRRGPGEFVIPDMVKLKVRKVPAKPARMGRNPATGEEMMLAPKPASKKIRATPLKKLKDLVL